MPEPVPAPHISVQKSKYQDRSINTESSSIDTVVRLRFCPVSVGTNRQQVLNHCPGALQTATFDGPVEWRDGLGADSDVPENHEVQA